MNKNDEIKKWEYSEPLEKKQAAEQRLTDVEMELAEAEASLEEAASDLAEAQKINQAANEEGRDKFSAEEMGALEKRVEENRRIIALLQELKTKIGGTIEQYQGIDEKLQALMKYADKDKIN